MPAISVVIPCYNRAHCVLQTLESVFEQTYRNYEVVVIDDGSTDGTKEVLSSVMERIRYIPQKNGGLADARNRGVQEARGEWIAFLDSDDLWLPEKLEIQMAAVDRSPDLTVHVTNASIFREHLGDELDLYRLSGFDKSYSNGEATRLERPFISCVSRGLSWMQCMLVRRSTLLAAGDFHRDLKIFMDFEMGARLSLMGPWEAYHKPVVRILRQDDGEVESISSRSSTPEGRRELTEVYGRMAVFPGLTKDERRFIHRRLSDARGSFGLGLSFQGKTKEGRRQLVKSFMEHKRLGSLVRLGAACMPRYARRLMIRQFFPHAVKELRERPVLKKQTAATTNAE